MNATEIFDLATASNDDIIDRYERIRTRPSREADALLQEIGRRLRVSASAGRITRKNCESTLHFFINGGEVFRRNVGRFVHLKSKTREKIYRVSPMLSPQYFEAI